MGVLVFGERASKLARTGYQRAGHVLAFLPFAVGLLDGADYQRTDRSARALRSVTKLVVQRLGYIHCSSDCHDIIMSQRGEACKSAEKADGTEGYSIEVCNAAGNTIAVTAVPASALEVLREDEILCTRSLDTP